MTKWIKFTDIDPNSNLAYVRFVDIEKVVGLSIFDESRGAELDLHGGEIVKIHEAFAIQTFEKYFTHKSIPIEKLEGKTDVL